MTGDGLPGDDDMESRGAMTGDEIGDACGSNSNSHMSANKVPDPVPANTKY